MQFKNINTYEKGKKKDIKNFNFMNELTLKIDLVHKYLLR